MLCFFFSFFIIYRYIYTNFLCVCVCVVFSLELFLNSHVHCGHGDVREMWYSVDKTSLYNVRDDVSPITGTHAFRECELVFQSTRRNGQLCMLQRSLKFDSCHVQLELYDGWMDVDGVSEPNRVSTSVLVSNRAMEEMDIILDTKL